MPSKKKIKAKAYARGYNDALDAWSDSIKELRISTEMKDLDRDLEILLDDEDG